MRKMSSALLLASVGWGCTEAGIRELPATPLDTVAAELTALIGEVDGAPEYLFGNVSAVAADRDGLTYVGDRIGSTVRVYAETGRYLGTVGVEGEGPGELTLPTDISFDPAGRLYVRDLTRLTVFENTDTSAFPTRVVRTVPLGRFLPEPTRGLATGTEYYLPSHFYRMFVTERYFYEVFDSLGATGDTVEVPHLEGIRLLGRASYLVSEDTGRPVPGVNQAPFEPRPYWAISPEGTVITAHGSAYEVVEWNQAGEPRPIVQLEVPARSVPIDWARDSADAFSERLDSIPVPLDQVRGMSDAARRRAPPNVLPQITGLHVGRDGNIWVGRWPPASQGHETYYDVFDRTGTMRLTVRVPARVQASPPPFLAPDRIVGVVADEATGVQRIAVFSLQGW